MCSHFTMSSREWGGKRSVGGTTDSYPKRNAITESSIPKLDQLSNGVADLSLDAAQDANWEVCARKSKNRAGGSSTKSWATQNSNSKAWGHPDVAQKLGIRSDNGSSKFSSDSWPTLNADSGGNSGSSQHPIPAPLEHSWNWVARAPASQSSEDGTGKTQIHLNSHAVVGDDDGDKIQESDEVDTDDELLTDEYDSDESEKSHESRKKNKWFNNFFEILDKLTVEEINEPARQWHCPACQGGPGAIDWYRGLQPLITHAKTKGSKRMKLHRDFAELLDEELRRRGTSVIPAGETFGKWKGLNEMVKDREIVWPPMVIIMNTRLEKDENDKWTGMGNQELLDYFSSYDAAKAKHSYGPQGHRGMSVLIFESSAVGFSEAERLHNHFQEQGTDREAWDNRRVLFYPGGKRQLYGKSTSRLKFEMRSYQEMVVNQMKQMSEDNQQLVYFKEKVAKEQKHSKALEESFGVMSEKLRKTLDENRIVRQRSKMYHEQNKEEMDAQEQFFKERLQFIEEARDEKDNNFEKIQQEEREKVKQSNADLSATEDRNHRGAKIAKFIESQDKGIEEFVAKRDKLTKIYEDKKTAMIKRHWEEKVELENEFDAEIDQLMAKYIPLHPKEGNKDQ
ncbi:Protein SUPPRESSOR [Sarracenia purpurea var. burkii]